jgi:hypothetical protein
MDAAHSADLAADSLTRYAADLAASSAPGCTSTRESVRATLAADNAEATGALERLAVACDAADPAFAVIVRSSIRYLRGTVTRNMLAYFASECRAFASETEVAA